MEEQNIIIDLLYTIQAFNISCIDKITLISTKYGAYKVNVVWE